MLIAGGCAGGRSELGALGFSKEKSLMYWPSTLSEGALASPGPPLVAAMVVSGPVSGRRGAFAAAAAAPILVAGERKDPRAKRRAGRRGLEEGCNGPIFRQS